MHSGVGPAGAHDTYAARLASLGEHALERTLDGGRVRLVLHPGVPAPVVRHACTVAAGERKDAAEQYAGAAGHRAHTRLGPGHNALIVVLARVPSKEGQ
eukprot:scaffold314591_cov36-Tisochrysis_lutea.AAC.2